jgi:NitT/TauT family transport system ATP-binding protein
MIRFESLEKIYPKTGAGLGAVNAEIPAGAWVSFLGASGCGKTTLLKLVAGLEQKSGGNLQHDFYSKEMSFVFQEAALLPWATVIENITLPLTLRGFSLAQATPLARPWIEKLKLKGFEQSYPAELSGGLKMRVSLARALLTNPKLLLLDEPFAALDEPIRIELGLELRELFKSLKPTILMVTHSITEALWLSDRVMVFDGQPGRLVLDDELKFGMDRPLALRGNPEFLTKVEHCFSLLRGSALPHPPVNLKDAEQKTGAGP